jgi:hypothetical protein
MPALNTIQLRRGSSSEWSTQVLAAGEIGYESNTGKFKIGDGITTWNSLAYAAVLPSDLSELVQDIIGNNVIAGSGISVNYDDNSGNTTVSLSDPTIQVSDITDLTATAAELNVLDGITATTTELNYVDISAPGTVQALKAIVPDANKDVSGIRNLVLDGDLTVNGTTTTVNSTIVTVDDKNIELGSVDSPTDTTADGGGITLKGDSDKELLWVNSTDCWTSNQSFNLNSGTLVYKINSTTVIGDNKIGASGYSLAEGVTIDGGTP